MLSNISKLAFFLCLSVSYVFAGQSNRIITLSSALSETVHALGLGTHLVAVDVTSEYPAYIKKLPRVSRNRSISAEGLLAFRPDVVLAPAGDVPPGVQQQLKRLGVKLVNVEQEYSVRGALRFIRTVAEALGHTEKGSSLAAATACRISEALARVETRGEGKPKPDVLFIYARGAGAMSVAGRGSSLDAIISLAGGRNAVQEFNDFKTYSTEALVKADPDVILMFDFGVSSLGGKPAVLKMPGMALTRAGRQQRIVEMDGPLLVNFATRLPDAISALNQLLLP